MQLLLLYFKAHECGDEECMLLLFKGVLCYVGRLSVEEVELQLRALPDKMSPEEIRKLLASTIWATQDAVHEMGFAQDVAYGARLPCGCMLAAAVGRVASQGLWSRVSRAEAAGLSLWALWIFSIDPVVGSLRDRVEHEGFLMVRRTEMLFPDFLCLDTSAEVCGQDEFTSDVEVDRPAKRGRY